MRKYIVRRVLLMFPTALLATILVFGLMQLVPRDAADAALADLDVGSREQAEEFEEKLRERHGLNDSIPVQYWNWLSSVGRAEFGVSTTEGRPVRDIIIERMPRTAELAIVAIILVAIYAIPMGIWAAIRQDRLADNVIRVVSISGLSVPLIWLGTVFLFTSSRVFNILPPLVWKGPLEDPVHTLVMVGTPAILLSFAIGASIIRMTRGPDVGSPAGGLHSDRPLQGLGAKLRAGAACASERGAAGADAVRGHLRRTAHGTVVVETLSEFRGSVEAWCKPSTTGTTRWCRASCCSAPPLFWWSTWWLTYCTRWSTRASGTPSLDGGELVRR